MVYSDQKSLDSLEDEEKKPSSCPECKSKIIIYEKGERFCKKCGYVFE